MTSKKRPLGNSNIFVSPLALGCWAFGGGEYWGEQNQNDVNEVVHAAIEHGINLFDTAEMYNNGASEQSLGLALQGKRHQAILCSKISPSNAYPDTMRKHCEDSLQRLNTDYLDVYMLHWPINPLSVKHFTNDEQVLLNPPTVEEAFLTLDELKKEGKIRAIGISNFGPKQIAEALATGVTIAVNEMPYNIISRAIEKEIVPACLKNNIGIVCSMALQQGILAGIYNTIDDIPAHQAHSRHFANERGRGTSRHYEGGAEREIFEALNKLRALAAELNVSLAQLSIAWTLCKPGISASLVGSRNSKELKENLQSLNVVLYDNIIGEIDRISQPVLDKLGSNPDYYENSSNSRIY